jgi:hypothetical protein
MLLDREFRGAGPDAQHTEACDITIERTERLRSSPTAIRLVHCGYERLAQLDSGVACHRDVFRLRATHEGHDGVEGSMTNHFPDKRVADRSGCTEYHRCQCA